MLQEVIMIECNHVYKQYKNGTNALYDLNISVEQGELDRKSVV